MAYILWKNKHAYIYDRIHGKAKCVRALGIIGPREAENERIQWLAENGKEGLPREDLPMGIVWNTYLQDLLANGRAEKTIGCYQDCAYRFIRTLNKLKELTPAHIENWNTVLKEWKYKRKGNRLIPLSTESRAHQLRAIRAFCGWLVQHKYFKVNPFQTKIPEQREDAGRALYGNQVMALFANWPNQLHLAELSKLFFYIVFYGGTRLSETLGYNNDRVGATHENVYRDKCILKLNNTKGNKPREIALPKTIIDLIPSGGQGPIFFGRIGRRTLAKHLALAKKAAGIEGRLRIHDGRVSAATEWARKNNNPKMSMNQFGWKTEKMAMHYQKVATEERVAGAQNITYR